MKNISTILLLYFFLSLSLSAQTVTINELIPMSAYGTDSDGQLYGHVGDWVGKNSPVTDKCDCILDPDCCLYDNWVQGAKDLFGAWAIESNGNDLYLGYSATIPLASQHVSNLARYSIDNNSVTSLGELVGDPGFSDMLWNDGVLHIDSPDPSGAKFNGQNYLGFGWDANNINQYSETNGLTIKRYASPEGKLIARTKTGSNGDYAFINDLGNNFIPNGYIVKIYVDPNDVTLPNGWETETLDNGEEIIFTNIAGAGAPNQYLNDVARVNFDGFTNSQFDRIVSIQNVAPDASSYFTANSDGQKIQGELSSDLSVDLSDITVELWTYDAYMPNGIHHFQYLYDDQYSVLLALSTQFHWNTSVFRSFDNGNTWEIAGHVSGDRTLSMTIFNDKIYFTTLHDPIYYIDRSESVGNTPFVAKQLTSSYDIYSNSKPIKFNNELVFLGANEIDGQLVIMDSNHNFRTLDLEQSFLTLSGWGHGRKLMANVDDEYLYIINSNKQIIKNKYPGLLYEFEVVGQFTGEDILSVHYWEEQNKIVFSAVPDGKIYYFEPLIDEQTCTISTDYQLKKSIGVVDQDKMPRIYRRFGVATGEKIYVESRVRGDHGAGSLEIHGTDPMDGMEKSIGVLTRTTETCNGITHTVYKGTVEGNWNGFRSFFVGSDIAGKVHHISIKYDYDFSSCGTNQETLYTDINSCLDGSSYTVNFPVNANELNEIKIAITGLERNGKKLNIDIESLSGTSYVSKELELRSGSYLSTYHVKPTEGELVVKLSGETDFTGYVEGILVTKNCEGSTTRITDVTVDKNYFTCSDKQDNGTIDNSAKVRVNHDLPSGTYRVWYEYGNATSDVPSYSWTHQTFTTTTNGEPIVLNISSATHIRGIQIFDLNNQCIHGVHYIEDAPFIRWDNVYDAGNFGCGTQGFQGACTLPVNDNCAPYSPPTVYSTGAPSHGYTQIGGSTSVGTLNYRWMYVADTTGFYGLFGRRSFFFNSIYDETSSYGLGVDMEFDPSTEIDQNIYVMRCSMLSDCSGVTGFTGESDYYVKIPVIQRTEGSIEKLLDCDEGRTVGLLGTDTVTVNNRALGLTGAMKLHYSNVYTGFQHAGFRISDYQSSDRAISDGDTIMSLTFSELQLEQGLEIAEAYIEMTAMNTLGGTQTIIRVNNVDTDDSNFYFNYGEGWYHNNPYTSIKNIFKSWTNGDQLKLDVTDIIQDIVDRPGWEYENNINIGIESLTDRLEVAYSRYLDAPNNPKLVIKYKPLNSTYNWTISGGGNSYSYEGAEPDITNLQDGTYTVKLEVQKEGNNCKTETTSSLEISGFPSQEKRESLCEEFSTTYDLPNGFNGVTWQELWYTEPVSQPNGANAQVTDVELGTVVGLTENGKYLFRKRNTLNGCVEDFILIKADPLNTGEDDELCFGTSTYDLEDGFNGVTYQELWNETPVSQPAGANAEITDTEKGLVIGMTEIGDYVFRKYNTFNGCENDVTITIHPNPNVGEDVSQCSEETTYDLPNGSSGQGYLANWDQSPVSQPSGANASIVDPMEGLVEGMTEIGDYVFRYVNRNTECYDEIKITIHANPDVGEDVSQCSEETTYDLPNGSSGQGYLANWDQSPVSQPSGANASIVDPMEGLVEGMTEIGDYVFRYVNRNTECYDEIKITIHANPDVGEDVSQCSEETTYDLPNGSSGQGYLANWDQSPVSQPSGANASIVDPMEGLVEGMTEIGDYVFRYVNRNTECYDEIKITIHANPDVGEDVSQCSEETTYDLPNGSSGQGYLANWDQSPVSQPSGANASIVDPMEGLVEGMTEIGDYVFRYVNRNTECYDEIKITIHANPDVGEDVSQCSEETTYDLPNGSTGPGYLVNWDQNPVSQPSGANASIIDPMEGLVEGMTESGDYIFRYVNRNTGCYDEVTISLDDNLCLGSMSGFVWHDADLDGRSNNMESKAMGVNVKLYDCEDNYIDELITDVEGEYHFEDLIPGNYYVVFELLSPNDIYGFTNRVGNVEEIDNSDVDRSGKSVCIEVKPLLESVGSTDAGLQLLASIGDRVWHDIDGDGLQEMGEPGLEGIEIKLFNIQGELVSQTQTNSTGNYIFDKIYPDNYYLQFIPIEGMRLTESNSGINEEYDNDAEAFGINGVNTTTVTYLNSGENDLDWDAGFYSPPKFCGQVWYDAINNDQFDDVELGLNGIKVELWRKESGNWILWDETSSSINPNNSSEQGYYSFEPKPGSYYLRANLHQTGLVNVYPNEGVDQTKDSDLTDVNGFFTTDEFVVFSGSENCFIGIGLHQSASIGDYVWLDANDNGVQDFGEEGVKDVLIEAYDINGEKIRETLTDDNGIYKLDYMRYGDYYIKATIPSGYGIANENVGGDLKDNDLDGTNGLNTTRWYNLIGGQNEESVDIGLKLGVVPVEWLSFDVRGISNYHQLEWSTQIEFNSSHYEIYRRHETEEEYRLIGKVVSEGTSNEISNYELRDYDVALPGVYYYKLKQIDFDGGYDYSETVSIRVSDEELQTKLKVYPNPAIDELSIELDLKELSEVKISIWDANGKLVLKNALNRILESGKHAEKLDVKQLDSGVYQMKININSESIYSKLIILNE